MSSERGQDDAAPDQSKIGWLLLKNQPHPERAELSAGVFSHGLWQAGALLWTPG